MPNETNHAHYNVEVLIKKGHSHNKEHILMNILTRYPMEFALLMN